MNNEYRMRFYRRENHSLESYVYGDPGAEMIKHDIYINLKEIPANLHNKILQIIRDALNQNMDEK